MSFGHNRQDLYCNLRDVVDHTNVSHPKPELWARHPPQTFDAALTGSHGRVSQVLLECGTHRRAERGSQALKVFERL
jgi:hypothetical protein